MTTYDFRVAMDQDGHVAISPDSADDAITNLTHSEGAPEAVRTVKFSMLAPIVEEVVVPNSAGTTIVAE
jgi:hypothetical protein